MAGVLENLVEVYLQPDDKNLQVHGLLYLSDATSARARQRSNLVPI